MPPHDDDLSEAFVLVIDRRQFGAGPCVEQSRDCRIAIAIQGVAQRRGCPEAQAGNGLAIAADEDHVAEVIHGVRGPVPHVERVYAVVRV